MTIYLYLSLAGMALALVSMAVLLSWLWRRLTRLERQFQEHRLALERLGEGLVDFCALSVRADEQIGELAAKLKELGEWLKEREDQANVEEPVYQSAIERIRQGADMKELVGSLGLSREEAALLIRLYSVGAGLKPAPASWDRD
ncbi:MAG: DUF2802 domain-containing protein [Methylohalobius sp.]